MYDQLFCRAASEFALDVCGIHGAGHWARVFENGQELAKITGADPVVVGAFAILHDSKRVSDGRDDEHGARAAQFAQSIRRELINLSDEAFHKLQFACVHHNRPVRISDATVQTCWDADRLDLGRLEIELETELLGPRTAAAKRTCEVLYRNGLHRLEPKILRFWQGRFA